MEPGCSLPCCVGSIVHGRDDGQPIGLLHDRAAEPPQFAGQVADAVGLLIANVGDVADRGRPVCEKCHHRERRHCVADRIHVDIDAADRAARHCDRLIRPVIPCDRTAHAAKRIGEADVALHAPVGKPFDPHAAAGDRSSREEIAGRRGVGFDGVATALVARCRDSPAAVSLRQTDSSKGLHDASRHIQIGKRNKRAGEFDLHALRRAWRHHGQATGKLARRAAADTGRPALHAPRANHHRRTSARALRGGLDA